MQKLQNDEPITNPEKDTLGYSSYARVVAERILQAPTPLTVGIFGPWGSGKTSLMRLIQNQCEPPLNTTGKPVEPKIVTLWINVWQLSGREDVWDAFLQALISQVHSKLPFRKKLNWKALGRQLAVNGYRIALALIPVIAGALVAGVKTSGSGAPSSIEVVRHFFSQPHNWVLGSTTGILELLLLFWAFREPLKSAVSFDLKAILKTGSYQERITELGRLSRQFASLVKEVVGEKGRLIVFIDDLDRCAAKAIPDVLEAIRLFASEEHCVYVLGLDQRAVWSAIRDVYKFATEEEAGRYFEKIVQIPFQLPPLSPPAIKGFMSELVPPEVAEVFGQGIEGTPRALKRSYQIYSIWDGLHANFMHHWQVDPLEPELMAKWLTIQMRFRKLSEFVAHKTGHLLWLEREALRKAAELRPLGPLDARLVEDAASDPQDSKAKELVSEYDEKELSALLIAGECRFNQRVYRETLDSYIYLGGGSSGSDGQVRAQSRERRMLFSGGLNERQQIINQLLHWPSLKRFRYLKPGDHYQERLLTAFNAPDVLESWEKSQVEALCRCFQRFDDNTVCVPPRRHILGAPAEWTDEARKDDKDNFTEELANRECQRPLISIPGFRIGRFPVANDEFQYYLDVVRSNGPHEPVPFSIVEYDAYCEPLAQKRWQYAPERESVNRRPGSVGTPPGLPEPKWKDTPESRTGIVELHLDGDSGPVLATIHIHVQQEKVLVGLHRPDGGGECSAAIDLIYRKSAMLKRPGLIVQVTLAGSLSFGEFGRPIRPGVPFTVVVRAWQADRFILLDRSDNQEWQFRSGHEKHPATNVSWEDAVAYGVWQRGQTGKPYRLPREPEWEAAATGDGQKKTRYPWGDKWNVRYTNSREGGLGCTTPVGAYSPEGDSAFAVADMAGNVAEWCADAVREMRDTTESGLLWEEVRKPFRGGEEPNWESIKRIARGGSFQDSRAFARTTCRCSYPPDHKTASVGFRIALATELEGLEGLRFDTA